MSAEFSEVTDLKNLQSKNNQQAMEVSNVDEKDDLELGDEQLEVVAGGYGQASSASGAGSNYEEADTTELKTVEESKPSKPWWKFW